MQTIDYITKDVKALQLSATVASVKLLFNELIFTHLPIVNHGNFIGLIAESDLPFSDNKNTKLADITYLFQFFSASINANWFDLLKDFAANDANIIPVITEDRKYLGYFELIDILHFFNNTPFLKEDGTILIITKNKNDYSLSEIAQIIERNNAKLFGAFISNSEGQHIEITIKLSSQNINEIIQTFRRYEYTIITKIKEDNYLNDLKERSEYLQKYLNI